MTKALHGSVRLAAIALLGLVNASTALSQATMRGTVMEEESRIAIPAAEVRAIDARGQMVATTLTDAEGQFLLELPTAGEYSVESIHAGYLPVREDSLILADNATMELRILLGLRAVPVEAVTVVANRQETARILRFRERAEQVRRSGWGRVYTREDLARIRPQSARELIDPVIWGVGCRPDILVDGMRIPEAVPTLSWEEIEGVEIYRGSTEIPLEFHRPGICGLAMVWSRTDPPGMKPLTWRRTAVAAAFLLLVGLIAR